MSVAPGVMVAYRVITVVPYRMREIKVAIQTKGVFAVIVE